MSEITRIGLRDVTVFRPEQTRERLAELDGDIARARALKDWPELAKAVAAKIAEQRDFVANWDATVHDKGGERWVDVAAAGHQGKPVIEAEDEWGFSKQTVSRWRTWLKDEPRYADRIMRGSLRAAGLIEPEERDYQQPIVPAGRYGTIVVDPPWDMQKIEREVRPNQAGFDYPTMTADELAEWPVVAQAAADDCHLFCWTTQRFLPAALQLVDAWGFRYCLTMVWHKPGGYQPYGLPQYNCEFIVYARRGAPVFIDTRDFFCCFIAPRREHSRKPEGFYDMVRRVTDTPRIDVFSREERDGFAQYGNEVRRFA